MSVSLGLSDPDDFLCQVGGYEECWELCRGGVLLEEQEC